MTTPRGGSAPATQAPPARVVPVVAVSALCAGLGSALGFIPGFVVTSLRDDLGISRGEVGLLISLYFGSTGIGSILGGRVTDRLGARVAVVVDMAMVAAAGLFSAWIGTYWSLLVAGVFAGAGYALVNAATNVTIARSIDSTHRTLAMSIKTAGVPALAMVAAALGPWASQRWSWRHISVTVAVCAVFAGLAALVVLDDDRPQATAETPSRALPAGFIWFPIGAFLLIAGSQPLYSWIVAYLEQSLGASAGVAGAVSAAASGAGVVIMIVNGQRTDRVGSERRILRIMTLLAINVLATTMVLLGAWMGVFAVLIGAVVGASVQLASIGTMHAAIVDKAPLAVATATGWTMTGYYLGALSSPAAFGWLADATDTFAWSWLATIVLMVLAIPAWHRAGNIGQAEAHS